MYTDTYMYSQNMGRAWVPPQFYRCTKPKFLENIYSSNLLREVPNRMYQYVVSREKK